MQFFGLKKVVFSYLTMSNLIFVKKGVERKAEVEVCKADTGRSVK
jgi:type III secretory pathway component EscV